MKMPDMRGVCGENVEARQWKNGHSFACSKRKRRSLRYWVPDPTLAAELLNFCGPCSLNPSNLGVS